MYYVTMTKVDAGIDIEALQWALDQKQWTAAKLSDVTGISRAVFSLLFQGKRTNISATNLSKIAAALEVSTDFLLGLSHDPRPRDGAEMNTAVAGLIAIAKTLPGFRQRDLLMIAQTYRDTVDPTAEMLEQILDAVEREGGVPLRAKLAASLRALAANTGQGTFGQNTGEEL